MPDTYPREFVKAFKRIFPKRADLHKLLEDNDMSEKAMDRISDQMCSLQLYSLTNETIVSMFEAGQEKRILRFAKKQIKTGKDMSTLWSLWRPPSRAKD